MPHFVASLDGRPVASADLSAGRAVLGSDLAGDFFLPGDDRISFHHCVVRFDGRRWWITDRSTNGTFLRGVRLPYGEEVEWDGTTPIGIAGLLVAPAQEFIRRPPVPTRRDEDTADIVVSGTTSRSTARVAVLVFTGGPRRGERVPLTAGEVSLGGAGCAIDLGAPTRGVVARISVVRTECTLEPVGGGLVVVAGQPLLREALLPEGRPVTIGAHTFAVRVEELVTRNPPAEAVGQLVGEHPLMLQLYGGIRRVARHDEVRVLIVGPTGTGKELVARAVHDLSPRHAGPYVVMNCGEVTPDLLPAHLFGYEKGAFTGAAARTDGLWRTAHGGTLVLDEFGEAPAEIQAQLLRAIETGDIRRVGGTTVDRPNVRVVCCTNRNLLDEADAERFRADLLHRVAAAVLVTPPLAARRSDVPLLAESFLARNHPAVQLTAAAKARLAAYDWPGNVRELRQVLVRAVVDTEDGRIDARHIRLTHEVFAAMGAPPAPPPPPTIVRSLGLQAAPPLAEMTAEEMRAERALRSPQQMAELRGVSRGQVMHWLRKRGVVGAAGNGRGKRSEPPR